MSRCQQEKYAFQEEDLIILLKWHPAYAAETPEKVITGLKWSLSYLGAMLPQETSSEVFIWKEDNVLKLNLLAAGFSDESLHSWSELIEKFKAFEEYQQHGTLDIGRFVMLTFNSSWHYYAITNVADSYKDFLKKYNFKGSKKEYLLPSESCVTSGIRTLLSAKAQSVKRMAHIAEEGPGKTKDTFVAEEFEVFDIMKNGQPRFAIYDI